MRKRGSPRRVSPLSDRAAILEQLNFHDIFSGLSKFSARNGQAMASCPFHSDNDPSFSVNLETGQFNCFGCGAKGSVFDYVIKRDDVDFKTALKTLADLAGVSVNGKNRIKPPRPAEPLEGFAQLRRISVKALQAIGGNYDPQSGEIRFPMRDARGTRTGWKRRDPGNGKITLQNGKKVKSGSLGKSGLLYPEPFPRTGPVLICEGEMDVLAALTAGVARVIGTSGCSISPRSEFLPWIQTLCHGSEVVLFPHPAKEGGKNWRDVIARAINKADGIAYFVPSDGERDLDDHLKCAQDKPATLKALVARKLQWLELPVPGESFRLENTNPPDLAEGFLTAYHRNDDGYLLLRKWRGEFYRFNGRCYQRVAPDELKTEIYRHFEYARTIGKGEMWEKFRVTKYVIGEVESALLARGVLFLDDLEDQTWIESDQKYEAKNIVPCANDLLHLPDCELLKSTPMFFTTSAIDCEWTTEVLDTPNWLRFLEDCYGDDTEQIEALQMWFGYCLVPDTRQEKILLMIGPPRSGKGKTADVLSELVGRDRVDNPTFERLSERFGLQPFIGKTLAVITDARLSSRSDKAAIAEKLLSISGADSVSADRKYLGEPWRGKLPIRFMILTNELPDIYDASGALPNRFIILELRQSFLGREDHGLLKKLLTELPGIFQWAIHGWHKLNNAGRLTEPTSTRETVESFWAIASPVKTFVDERCDLGDGFEIECGDLYQACKAWLEEKGRKVPNGATFGKRLHAAFPQVRPRGRRKGDVRWRVYEGIKLANS